MDNVKFKKQVVPGDQLVFEMEVLSFRRDFCKLKGKAYKGYVGGELAAEGEFSSRLWTGKIKIVFKYDKKPVMTNNGFLFFRY